jgi:hypothetical protein
MFLAKVQNRKRDYSRRNYSSMSTLREPQEGDHVAQGPMGIHMQETARVWPQKNLLKTAHAALHCEGWDYKALRGKEISLQPSVR